MLLEDTPSKELFLLWCWDFFMERNVQVKKIFRRPLGQAPNPWPSRILDTHFRQQRPTPGVFQYTFFWHSLTRKQFGGTACIPGHILCALKPNWLEWIWSPRIVSGQPSPVARCPAGTLLPGQSKRAPLLFPRKGSVSDKLPARGSWRIPTKSKKRNLTSKVTKHETKGSAATGLAVSKQPASASSISRGTADSRMRRNYTSNLAACILYKRRASPAPLFFRSHFFHTHLFEMMSGACFCACYQNFEPCQW